MKRLAGAATITLLTLTGCSSGIEQDATYENHMELSETLNSLDLDLNCKPSETENMLQKEGWGRVGCTYSTAAVYSSDRTRQYIYDRNPLDPGERRLSGPNWSFEGDQYLVETVQEHLGGTVEPVN